MLRVKPSAEMIFLSSKPGRTPSSRNSSVDMIESSSMSHSATPCLVFQNFAPSFVTVFGTRYLRSCSANPSSCDSFEAFMPAALSSSVRSKPGSSKCRTIGRESSKITARQCPGVMTNPGGYLAISFLMYEYVTSISSRPRLNDLSTIPGRRTLPFKYFWADPPSRTAAQTALLFWKCQSIPSERCGSSIVTWFTVVATALTAWTPISALRPTFWNLAIAALPLSDRAAFAAAPAATALACSSSSSCFSRFCSRSIRFSIASASLCSLWTS